MSSTEQPKMEDYTRVTQVLSPFSGLDKIPKHIVQNAGERGTRVHHICESISKGLGEFDMDEVTTPYVESFKQWWSEEFEVLEIERRFFDDHNNTTGAIDYILDDGNGLAIVDLKTSYKESNTWLLQGSAYYRMARLAGFDIKQVLFVHLSKVGAAPKVIKYEPNVNLWNSVLETYNYFHRKKK